MDETAISNLRKEKDAEICKLQKECEQANARADKSDDIAIKMTHRLTKTEGQFLRLQGFGTASRRTRKPSCSNWSSG